MKKEMIYRPLVHFAPADGWMNDPNGMVYIDGKYHLFFQYYPQVPLWGPMHWGHAVSEDLLHWEELPAAIYPDENGMIFSGSCVFDKENVSGLGQKAIPELGVPEKAPLIAIFTSHKNIMDGETERGQEQQSIAYSTDYVHFEKYIGNPVIKNTEKPDFRDPKAFWNPVKNCYSLVLAAGPNVEFYASKDLKNWEKTGEFKAGENGLGGICECPDCFRVKTDDGKEKWILIISMILPPEEVGKKNDATDRMTHITQYYVGEFDGDVFHDTEQAGEALVLDYGTDNYAAVTFQNLEEPVMIGWADNWSYARLSPTDDEKFRGKMSFARKMRLVTTEKGYRLAYTYEGLEVPKAHAWALETGVNRLRMKTFGIHANVKGSGEIVIANEAGEKIVVSVTEDEITVDRRAAGQKAFSEHYQKESYGINRAPRTNGAMNLELILDNSVLEVLADDGRAPFTVNVFPTKPYTTVAVTGDITAEMYEVK